MAYTPPDRHALTLRISGAYTPPNRHTLVLRIAANVRAAVTRQGQRSGGSGQQVFQRATTAQGQSSAGAGRNLPPIKRYITAEAGLPWASAARRDVEARLPLVDGARADLTVRMGSAAATPLDPTWRLPWSRPDAVDCERRLVLSIGARVEQSLVTPWRAAAPRDAESAAAWQQAGRSDGTTLRLPWQRGTHLDQERRLPWLRGARLDLERRLPYRRGAPIHTERALPWGRATPIPWVVPPPVPPVVPPPVPRCYLVPAHHALLFKLGGRLAYSPPARHALAFDLRCGTERLWDVRRTLRMTHSVSVVRWPDNLPLKTTGGSLSLDRNSWAWTAQLQFADAASLIAVEPTPTGLQQIKITLDGYAWILQVDGYTEDRQSGHRGGSVTATSAIAQLDAPYSPARAYINPSATTAQQLVLDELGFSGIALDWRITDWPVPAGAYSYDQATPLGSITKIAGAAGAMVQSADDSGSLIIAARLADAPWNFDSLTPDFTLAGGSWLTMGKKWNAGGRYNGVYVSGQAQGVLVNVYRTGTAGSPYAQLVVDPLILDVAPARARGLTVIADSLPRHEIPITLPLAPSGAGLGLMRPGELGLIEDTVWGTYRAIVDSLQVSYSVASSGVVTARQAATLWRYLP